jgi:hypothetical protein
MPAPTGNQFAKGRSNGGGRKGYEFEKKQLEKMTKILNKGLVLLKKIQGGRANEKEIERFQILERSVLKIMDKLHANKQETKLLAEARVVLEGLEKIWK